MKLNFLFSLCFTFVVLFAILSPFLYSSSFVSIFINSDDVYTEENALFLHNEVYNFLLNGEEMDEYVFSLFEILYMSDVRELIICFEWFIFICLSIMISLIVLNRYYDVLSKKLFYYYGLYGIIGFFLLLFLIFSFRFSFNLFHEIFFSGNYTFLYGSPLVTLYTLSFFKMIGISLFSVWIVSSVLAFIYYFKSL